MNPGKLFEKDFIGSVPPVELFQYRLRDCAGWKRTESDSSGSVRFTPSNDFDSILYGQGTLFLLELKSVKGKSIPYSRFLNKDGTLTKQSEALLEGSYTLGINAGYVINYRAIPTTVFIPIQTLLEYIENSNRKSIPYEDAKRIGYEIKSTLKRTRYDYDITRFVKECAVFEFK